MKTIVSKIVTKLMVWCSGDKELSISNTFNSIRINALIEQLSDNGLISKNRYDKDITTGVCDVLFKRSVNSNDRGEGERNQI